VAGEVAGDVAGEVAGEVAGDVAGEVAGKVAGEVAGELARDDRGPVEAGAVVAGAGDEGGNDVRLNGGRSAIIATMR
jgi:hypothetical protein